MWQPAVRGAFRRRHLTSRCVSPPTRPKYSVEAIKAVVVCKTFAGYCVLYIGHDS